MPQHGDQYRDTPATTNPFIERTSHVSSFTAEEIATLQSRLDKQLGPEYISTRPGNGGGKVHYLAAEKVINLANEVFGFNGWSTAIQNVQVDFVDENKETGRINLGLSTIVRVTLKDGSYHEDIGYGHCENTKGKAAAFEKAKKEAATDALKRALRNFGNILGNCLYDKDYLAKVTRLKIAPTKWDAENLHRHQDYAPIKREAIVPDSEPAVEQQKVKRNTSVQSAQSGGSFGSVDFEDDFSGQFDEADFAHADEVHLDETSDEAAPLDMRPSNGRGDGEPRESLPRMQSRPQARAANESHPGPAQNTRAQQRPATNASNPNQAQPPGVLQQAQRGSGPQHNSELPKSVVGTTQALQQGVQRHDRQHQWQCDGVAGDGSKEDALDDNGLPLPRLPPPGIPEGFVTGRKAELLNQPPDQRPPNVSLAFDPHAESPSIRRTNGINPGKSAPVSRQQIAAAVPPGLQSHAAQNSPSPGPGSRDAAPPTGHRTSGVNFVNPAADPNRRIGMPSPNPQNAQNRGGYRPPTAVKRPALADVSNLPQMEGASDPKRAKTEAGAPLDMSEQSVSPEHKGDGP